MYINLNEIIDKFKIDIKGVIHIGAHKGEELFSYYNNNIKNVILIEANKDLITFLKFKSFFFKKIFNMNIDIYNFAAFSEKNKSLELNITSNSQSSSILKLKKHKDLYPKIILKKKKLIITNTINNIFEKNLSIENYNFINIDIQGAELDALKGCSNILKNIDAIYTEINFDELYENCTMADELDSFLNKFNFSRVLTRTPEHHSWGDALYIKTKL